jgi:TolA-binding protein
MLPNRAIIKAAFLVGLILAIAFTAVWKAYDLGQRTERTDWLARENSDLREQQKEIGRLVTEVKEKQDAYNEDIKGIREFERRPTAGQLRHQELAALAARADADRLRALAAQAERDIEWTEAERSRFGIEAAEASAAAHANHRDRLQDHRKEMR